VRGLIAELVSAHHQVTIVDMEAGVEHLSRSGGTLRYIDQLLIVTEMDRKALETARRTAALSKELGIASLGVIGNKVRDENDIRDLSSFCAAASLELIAALPYDEAAQQADRRGVPLYDSARDAATVRALDDVVTKLERTFELLPAREPVKDHTPAFTAEQMKKARPECD
jgi:CO dehydrogenase maturation factor